MFTIENIKKFKFRPAARLITSIGEGLIKDVPAAIVELVKNSFDADASVVEIIFSCISDKENKRKLSIVVKDDGHGMNFDTVINKWMVPATSDKLKRKRSLLKKRIMQGRKGIGRYASAILGSDLTLTTKDLFGNKTIAKVNWKEFEEKQYLTDIDILIRQIKTDNIPDILSNIVGKKSDLNENEINAFFENVLPKLDEDILKEIILNMSSGTELEIIGDSQILDQWTENRVKEMIKDLKKLLSPLKKNTNDFKEQFKIKLTFKDFPLDSYNNIQLDIEPYPVIEMYDYRIYGSINEAGVASLFYENNSSKLIKESINEFKIFLKDDAKYCGPIEVDLRVFDKDPQSIDNLIQKGKGLIDEETGKFLGKLEAKKLIREISGVGIYRGDFRIRPYGDKGYDWLELDKERVQNPSRKIGNDQIVGFVKIESEELSNLEEKSARDGLKETQYYEGLSWIVKEVLAQLETKRYVFRKKTGKGRRQVPIHEQLGSLFDFHTLSNEIENKLQELRVGNEKINEFTAIIKKSEEEKSQLLEEIQEKIAMYQGQATLGKIIMVLQHEGRRPIGYIKNQVPVFEGWSKQLLSTEYIDKILIEKMVDRLLNIKAQSEILSNLFLKIDPLSVKRRGRRKIYKINDVLNEIKKLFEVELQNKNINLKVNSNSTFVLFGWKADLAVALTNILENSIYWLTHSDIKNKEIVINVFSDQEASIVMDIIDNGPGIDETLIDANTIFEPDFTTKSDGTGLGLAIAGEALARNNAKLKALNYKKGAYFRIEFWKEDKVND